MGRDTSVQKQPPLLRIESIIEASVNDPGYVEFLATKGEVPNVVKGGDLGVRLQAEFDALAEVSKGLGL